MSRRRIMQRNMNVIVKDAMTDTPSAAAPLETQSDDAALFRGTPEAVQEMCRQILAREREALPVEPQGNPVKSLAFRLSRALEAGELKQECLGEVARLVAVDALKMRAQFLREYGGHLDSERHIARLRELVRARAEHAGGRRTFADFEAQWATLRQGIVFTAHPTFHLSSALRAAVAGIASGSQTEEAFEGKTLGPDKTVTLEDEHEAAMAAADACKTAISTVLEVVYGEVKQLYPNDWRRFSPRLATVGTWVGYDLDGRADINWTHSLAFRLAEKRRQLARYLGAAQALLQLADAEEAHAAPMLRDLTGLLEAGLTRVDAEIAKAPGLNPEPDDLAAFANAMSEGGEGRITSIQPLERLVSAARDASPDESALSVKLAVLLEEMRSYRLGAAEVHFRLNATQLRNAIRRELDLDTDADLTRRRFAARLNDEIKNAKPIRVNFASVDIERATAARQFILMAQILKHIDGDAPIRLLIAETESAIPPLAAIYFAKRYGIENHIDVSPLFETSDALAQGERILASMLASEEYREQVQRRGRMCIQTGFSDAGRFVGQIPATLAIERVQVKLAELMEASGLRNVEALVFNTHGESMGRGGHPESYDDRSEYALSPHARRVFADRGINLIHELSFQGGDGYLRFGCAKLALATVASLVAKNAEGPDASIDDVFYKDTDASLDLFNRVREYQEHLLEAPHYHRSVTAFGLSLLPTTGSRKSRRQADVGGDGGPALRKIRAIPHNAILQQLGYLVNVLGGFGAAARSDMDAFEDMRGASARMQCVLRLVERAWTLSSLKTFSAYASLYDASFWATRPVGRERAELFEPCLYLAELLGDDDRFAAMMRLAVHLRLDELQLQQILGDKAEMGGDLGRERRDLDILHAIRIALVQHIFLLAAQVPPFSPRNDISREDIMNLIFELRLPEAIDSLRRAFPRKGASIEDYDMSELADDPNGGDQGYADINDDLIDPMERACQTLREISTGVAAAFGAFG